MPTETPFGKFVREQCGKKDLSLTALAAQIRRPESYLQEISNGTARPSIQLLHDLGATFGISMSEVGKALKESDEVMSVGQHLPVVRATPKEKE